MADQDNQLFLQLCKLQELFKGRFSVEEVAVILHKNDMKLDNSVKFILDNSPEDVRHMLETEKNSWTTIETKTRRLKKEHSNGIQKPSILDRAKAGLIDTNYRLFACGPCDFSWWRRIPERKQVSRCKKCRVRYDPVPREKEWGWAEFKCPYPGCGREFGGFCVMNTTSKCFGCGRDIFPTRILPPTKQTEQRVKKNRHQCNAPDCPHRINGDMRGPYSNHGQCAHPLSRRSRGLPNVITPSEPHDSTGSTVETFLDQSDLTQALEVFWTPTLGSVQEEDNDDAGSLSGNPGSDDGGENPE